MDKFQLRALGMIAGVSIVSGAVMNAPMLEQQCEGQLRTGCQGLPPSSYHVDNQDPMRGPMGPPMIATNTNTGPTGPTGPVPSFINGTGGLMTSASGIEGNGTVFTNSPLSS
jgi:hypothetical protein